MNNYAVFLEGNNFLLDAEGIRKHFGFFVTKRVIAYSEVEAGKMATQAVWDDPILSGQDSNPSVPTVVVKVIHELFRSNNMHDTQYSFFEMDEE